MIDGIGIDMVDVDAFRDQLADPASSFVTASFTEGERRVADERPSGDPARHLAARYAAKEALIKAWSGSNWGGRPVLRAIDMRDIEVVSDAFGRPRLCLHGTVAAALDPQGTRRIHLSLTHDGPVASAFVVLEPSTDLGSR